VSHLLEDVLDMSRAANVEYWISCVQ